MSEQSESPSAGVAIIGMVGRFPGAGDVEGFWRNLCQGVESLTHFTDEDLAAAGVDRELASKPGYVKAGFVLEGVELFDAAFFGFSPREAELLDPQHRLFLECAWEAMEQVGHATESFKRSIALFAGAGAPSYFYKNLLSRPDLLRSAGSFQLVIGNEKDFLPTRVAHELGLRGPCVAVQTACSTSLVAVHLACQSLLSGESDLALAGGVSLSLPQRSGYLYREGDVASPDGHCRAFDEHAQGAVRGSGVAVVVLKRLDEALADGDLIHAVIRGSAVNNDGSERAGYTAPGVEGQAAVISEALGMAGVEPSSLQYIEAHGTGTPLGDPIEVAALNKVFHGGAPNTCALGSVKTNIGHLDAAAGVTGLIKTALALRHRFLPPSLHFERPNPRLDLAGGPFFVNAAPRPWETQGVPRRAGVSSFGIGGTNAHVILEEAPPAAQAPASSRPWHLLTLSARTAPALEAATDNLAAHLERHPELELADVAHTLLVGRRRFEHRRVVVCRDASDARAALASRDPQRLLTQVRESAERPVIFMFPGQGAQYVGMGAGLYESEPVFRKHVDACCEQLLPHLGLDLRQLLFAPEAGREEATRALERTALTQPALFVIEYALARLWMAWGVKPWALVGHSLGEYVAACLAGVLSLEDALALVAARGRLMQELPGGAMLSVSLPEQEVRPLLGEALSLAAVNAPSLCVVSGPTDVVGSLESQLARRGVPHRRLHTSHAFHSAMMEPILDAFAARVRQVRLSPPRMPYISNLTGTWISAEQATDAGYWVEHLRRTVRFGDGLATLLAEPGRLLLEVGPGQVLGTFARQVVSPGEGPVILPSLRHPHESRPDLAFLLETAGRLWLDGVRLEGAKLYASERRRRVPLPTYPFQRERFWVEPGRGIELAPSPPKGPVARKPELADWFYTPAWKQERLAASSGAALAGSRWLVFLDAVGLGQRLVERLEAAGAEVVGVVAAESFSRSGPRRYAIDPRCEEHYTRLLGALREDGPLPERIVHLWSVTHEPATGGQAPLEERLALGFYAPLFLARAFQGHTASSAVELSVITNGLQDVTGEEALEPEKALVLGPCKVLPQELSPGWRCRSIDVVLPAAGGPGEARLVEHLLTELAAPAREPVVAWRGGKRWVETFAPSRLPEPAPGGAVLREGGVYLITGGLGRIGLAFAEHLATVARANLVLVGRSPFPAREEWEAWLAAHGEEDETSRKVRRLLALERAGARVLVLRADVSRPEQVQAVLERTRAHFGALHGVVHSAGSIGADTHVPVLEADVARCDAQFVAKVRGLRVLAQALEGRDLDFVVLQSSLAAVLGGLGFAAYASANAFMDTFALQRTRAGRTRWLSVGWDGWAEDKERLALTFEEGLQCFQRVLATGEGGRWLVSTGELSARLALWVQRPPASSSEARESAGSRPAHARPRLPNPYVAPRNESEQRIAALWQELLGIEQVGIHDNFFELGGHSLLGTQMVSRVRESFQVDVPLREVFDTPTVAGVALVVVQARAATTANEDRLAALLAELESE
ncbi:type I polyketide synthase [Archangium sp.]|uniref:type I polyketide synthase n=1 Tax=Archangium sp. TaxID=1872627 RepID=UPI002D3C15D8|nr:SDR family NAD(P)-dependent oxidoreductase [Archangium sp.]HYO51727.1 SDR family NAD(P)-dependent oxidoreductase [Archangium sp.]